MHIVRRTLRSTLFSAAALCAVTLIGGAATSGGFAGATTPGASIPQPTAAIEAAQWLGAQLSSTGFIPGATPTTPDLSATANAVLALAATGVDPSGVQTAVSYLEANSASYILADGSDGPGQLSLLILDAEATGVDPTNFGGTNLVSRLSATEQTSGPDAGLFGTESQLGDYDAGTFNQGLALAALKEAGVTADSAALTWLVQQQCPDGGWALPDIALNTCTEDPSTFAGPDTNSTSMAIQGLQAQGAVTSGISASALSFLQGAQNADAGWGYQPTNSTDPDSTALVIQALLALGQSPTSTTYTQSDSTPVSALLSFEIATGADAGAFYYPGGGTTTGDVLATYQAAPALAGVAFPFAVPTAPAPTVTSVSADTGPTAGGTSVTITGTNLTTAGLVDFGTAAATFTVESATQIVATSPAVTSAGPVDVTVATLGGTSATGAADTFTYATGTTTTTTAAPTSTTGAGTTSTSAIDMALTGINLSPLLFGGMALIGVGGLMVASDRRIRRAGLRRLAVPPNAGERGTQNW
jgi:IPT/TIG domain-containing protein